MTEAAGGALGRTQLIIEFESGAASVFFAYWPSFPLLLAWVNSNAFEVGVPAEVGSLEVHNVIIIDYVKLWDRRSKFDAKVIWDMLLECQT